MLVMIIVSAASKSLAAARTTMTIITARMLAKQPITATAPATVTSEVKLNYGNNSNNDEVNRNYTTINSDNNRSS